MDAPICDVTHKRACGGRRPQGAERGPSILPVEVCRLAGGDKGARPGRREGSAQVPHRGAVANASVVQSGRVRMTVRCSPAAIPTSRCTARSSPSPPAELIARSDTAPQRSLRGHPDGRGWARTPTRSARCFPPAYEAGYSLTFAVLCAGVPAPSTSRTRRCADHDALPDSSRQPLYLLPRGTADVTERPACRRSSLTDHRSAHCRT
jgi:hypothetical protein